MIALDEEMVGRDSNSIIVQNLQSCMGLFVQLNTGILYGAHFTTGTTSDQMNTIMKHIRDNAPARGITWIGMVTKFAIWTAKSKSGLTTTASLANYFRERTGFGGNVTYADLDWAAISYDIQCTTGITPKLQYRATPPNPNTIDTPLPNVFKLTNNRSVLSPTDGTHPAARHLVPTDTKGFADLLQDLKEI